MRRVFAALLAVGLIVASIGIRALIDDKVEEAKGPVRVVCTPELADVCRALELTNDDNVEVTIETPAATSDRLGKLTDGAVAPFDGWLAPQPWASSVNDGRARTGLAPVLDLGTNVVARTPLVIVAWRDRARVLAVSCEGGVLSWKCAGELAGKPWTDAGGQEQWGKVKVGHTNPGADGVGTLALGHAVVGWFGRTDVSRTDLESDDPYISWVRNLERQVQAAGAGNALSSPLERMATQKQSAYDVVAATEAQSATLFAASPTFAATVVAVYPTPIATADLRPVTVRGSPASARAKELFGSELLKEALSDAGWRVQPATKPVGVTSAAPPSLPSTSGLPSDGLLEYLYRTWKDS